MRHTQSFPTLKRDRSTTSMERKALRVEAVVVEVLASQMVPTSNSSALASRGVEAVEPGVEPGVGSPSLRLMRYLRTSSGEGTPLLTFSTMMMTLGSHP